MIFAPASGTGVASEQGYARFSRTSTSPYCSEPYYRTGLLVQHRPMMDAWAAFIAGNLTRKYEGSGYLAASFYVLFSAVPRVGRRQLLGEKAELVALFSNLIGVVIGALLNERNSVISFLFGASSQN